MSARLIRPLLIFAFYGLLAVIITWPLAAQVSSSLAGFAYGDGREMAHHLWWFGYALRNGEPLFYQTLLGYPNGIDAISLWANPLQFFPAWALALVLPLPFAANVTLLLTLALNGLAMFALATYLLRGEKPITWRDPRGWAALIAGAAYLMFPTMQGHLGAGHAGLIVQWPVPLYVLALLRLAEPTRLPRRATVIRVLAAAFLFIVSGWGHTLQILYVTLPLTLFIVLAWAAQRQWRAVARLIMASLLGMIGLILFLLPVASATFSTSAYQEGGNVRYSADLLALVTPSFLHPVFGQWEYTHRVLGVNLDEGAAYVGVIAFMLIAIALVKRPAARRWLIFGGLVWLFSLGSLLKLFDQPLTLTVDGYASFITLPGALLEQLPIINLARTPGRFLFAVAFAVAVLVAYGTAWLLEKVSARGRSIVGLLLIGGIAFEYWTFEPFPTIPAAVPQAVHDLAQDEAVRAVFDVPWNNLVAAKAGLYLQTAHEHPLLAGQVTRRTPVNPAMLGLLETTLDATLLNGAGVDVVIVHREQDDGSLYARARERMGEPFYENMQYALFRVGFPRAASGFFTTEPPSVLTSAHDIPVYAPGVGWVQFNATLDAGDATRTVELRRDGETLHRWQITGRQMISLPIPVNTMIYHTLTLALEPPCPAIAPPGLLCQSVGVEDGTFAYSAATSSQPVAFQAPGETGESLRLEQFSLPETTITPLSAGDTVSVPFFWRFSTPRTENDIRFVHLLDAAGNLVAQVDTPVGNFAANAAWTEQVDLPLPDDLSAEMYTLQVGWYRYPDIAPFQVLAGEANPSTSFTLGTFQVE